MPWLNYHHLLYFWTVARTGTIALAGKELHLSQPTISTQIKTLEDALGQRLFQRQGRRLALTDTGRVVYRYADDIFRLGREMTEVLSRGPVGQALRFSVGVADVIPKMVAQRLLEPAFDAVPDVQLQCDEGPLAQLLARLALHELDVVLSEQPAPNDIKVRAFSHKLGGSGTSFFGHRSLGGLARRFPASLDGAPVLLPNRGTWLRGELDSWFQKKGVRPRLVGEFDDSALMKVFGARGRGVFTAPTAIETEVGKELDVVLLGRAPELMQSFYAISVERRLRHPAVVAVAETARRDLFG
jgi:LysR family transcriptional regulator, transcriptional activator of nhaA